MGKRTLKFALDTANKKRYDNGCVQEWRNWQTRRLQVPVAAMSCGFKSHLLHSLKRERAEVSELVDEQD